MGLLDPATPRHRDLDGKLLAFLREPRVFCVAPSFYPAIA